MGFSRALIQLSYVVEDSARYRRVKDFFYDLLDNPRARVRPYFDIFMILLFRLFKLFRYTRSISEFVKVLSEKRIELLTLFIFMAFITFTAASALFFFESDVKNRQINTFFDSIDWA